MNTSNSGLSVAIDAHRLTCEPHTSGATYLASLLKEWRGGGDISPLLLLPSRPGENEVHGDLLASFPHLYAPKPFDPSASLRAQLRWAQVTVPRLLRRIDAPVYFSPFHLTPMITGKTVVTTIHDLCFLNESRFRGYVVHRLSLSTALRKAKRLVVVSKFTESQLRTFRRSTSERVTLVYNGVEDPGGGRSERKPTPRPFVLWIGSFAPRKDPSLVVEIERELQVDLVALVPPRDVERARASFSPGTRVVTSLTSEERDSLLREASLLLFPSSCEGFGYPAVEAMQHGCPVVAVEGGAIAELLGGVVPTAAPEPAALVGLCRRLLDLSGDDRAELEERLTSRSRFFSTRSMAKATARVLRDAAAE